MMAASRSMIGFIRLRLEMAPNLYLTSIPSTPEFVIVAPSPTNSRNLLLGAWEKVKVMNCQLALVHEGPGITHFSPL